MTTWFERLGRFATRRSGAVIAVYLVVSLALLWKGSSIRLETSLAELLPRENRAARDFRDLLDEDGTLDRLLVSIGLDPAPADPIEGLEPLVEAAEALSDELRRTGLVRSVRFGVEPEELSVLSDRAIAHLPVLIAAEKAPLVAERLGAGWIREHLAAIGARARMPGFIGPIEEMAARDPLELLGLAARGAGTLEGFRPDPESGLFLSRDGRRLLLVAEASEPPTRIAFSRRLIEGLLEAEEATRAALPETGLTFEHAGGHLFALEDERRIRHDAAFTSAFSIAAIALIYLFVIRRPVLWLVVLLPLTMTTIWTLGLASIYPGRLNMITVAFAAILLGIGDDAMIHMYLRERQERSAGLSARDSAVAALAGTGRAVTLATLTTTVAFLSLAFVQFRGLAELGVISALGMLTLLVGVLFFFPAALAVLARRPESPGSPALRMPLGLLLALHDGCRSRRRQVLGAAAAGSLVMLLVAWGTEISTDLRSIRGEDPAAEATRRLMGPFEGGAAETMVVLHGPRAAERTQEDSHSEASLEAAHPARAHEARDETSNRERQDRRRSVEDPVVALTEGVGPLGSRDAIDAALLEAHRLLEFCTREAAEGRISGCDNPAALVPPRVVQEERHAALVGLPWKEAADMLEEEALRAGMDPAFFSGFTEAARRYDDLGSVRVVPEPKWFGPSGMPRTRIFVRDPADAPALAAGVEASIGGPDPRIASVALLSHDLGRIIASDFRMASLIAAIAIAVLSLSAFRAIGVLIVTLTPVAVGMIWLLGTARLAGVELDLMSLMGMPVVFGLGVDFGVYVVDRWSREGRDPRAALAAVGPAVLVSGLTTLAGFAALLGADLAGLRSLGFTVVVGTGYTLASALILLPLLLPIGARSGDRPLHRALVEPGPAAGATAAPGA